jgi:hypothetical protein
MVKMLTGLITYLLLTVYCHTEHAEKVSIRRVRELRSKIKNEAGMMNESEEGPDETKRWQGTSHART